MKRPNTFHLVSKMYNTQASTVSVFQGKYVTQHHKMSHLGEF
jgi:hypothetical protein